MTKRFPLALTTTDQQVAAVAVHGNETREGQRLQKVSMMTIILLRATLIKGNKLTPAEKGQPDDVTVTNLHIHN